MGLKIDILFKNPNDIPALRAVPISDLKNLQESIESHLSPIYGAAVL
jgi:hypothetical protein